MKDPWSDFPVSKLLTEQVKRHRYSALRKVWTTDEVEIKIERKAFNRGAMRECFRLANLQMLKRKKEKLYSTILAMISISNLNFTLI